MRPHFPILLLDLLRREAPASWAICNAGGRWCATPPVLLCVMGRSPSRTAGKKMPAIRHLLWRLKFPRFWLRQISRISPDMPTRHRLCAIPPTPGTTTLNAGSMRTGGDLAQQLGIEGYYVRIAPRRPTAQLLPRRVSFPSRTGRRDRTENGLSHHQPGRAGSGALWAARSRTIRAS